jgi:hypothetical protein
MHHLLRLILSACAVLLPSVAIAQTVAEAPPGDPWWVSAIVAVGTLLGSLFVWLLRSYGGKWVSLIVAKTGNQFLGELAERALITVLSFYQGEVKNIKGTAAWDQAAKEALKARAIYHLQMMLDPAKVRQAAGDMGVEDFLGHYIEAAVAKAKLAGKSGPPVLVGEVAGDTPVDPTQG